MAIRVPEERNRLGGYAVLDDRLLVLDFQAGNPQAFVEIHRRYAGLARHVCYRFLPNQQDADEAFQETMIRVFQGLHRFNGRYSLQPWIGRIAKNVSLDMLRGRARRPQADDGAPAADELPVPGDQADEIVERLVQRDTVLTVLADLPESHREALVLRELDGLSHREIAEEMEMSPSQAKALIHRAKVSFRRRWLEKVAERGGFMGLALVPLLWLVRAANAVRRLGDRAGAAAQAAQAAVPDAVTSTVTASAAPAASGVSERLVAAGMTLLLAGGVTVGAAKLVQDQGDEKGVARVAAEMPAADQVRAPEEAVQPPRFDDPRVTERNDKGDIRAEPPVIVVSEPDPAAEPSPAPAVEPEPSPAPEPEPSPEPAVPPQVPAWSFDFTSSMSSVETCDCADAKLVMSQTRQTEGGFGFSMGIKGGVRDAAGEMTWPFALQQWGSVQGLNGSLDFRFTLGSAAGTHLYGGSAILAEVAEVDDGAHVYRFAGTYDLSNRVPAAGLPSRGFVSAVLLVWSDGTIYGGSFALEDVVG